MSPIYRRVRLDVAGMTCADCERHVTEALTAVGARNVSADFRRGWVQFERPRGLSETDLRGAVAGAGYTPGALTNDAPGRTGPAGGNEAAYDLVVLGAGSAAFAAAIKGTEAGYRVGLVEAGTLGGTCVNVGCVPSKALLRAGELFWNAGHHSFAGVPTKPGGQVDLAALVAQKDDLVGALRQAKYADLVDAYGFDVLPGRARFAAPDTVEVDGRALSAGAVLVATGASPAAPPIPGLAEAGYLTSTTALDLKEAPPRLAVIGANAIGLELGQFFLHLGSTVTFLDVAPRIAPFEEPEVSEALAASLQAQGARVMVGAEIRSVERRGDRRVVEVLIGSTTTTIEVDEILVATGRRPNSEGLGLEVAGVAVNGQGAVEIDDQGRTTNPRVWAAGDVTASPQFVYVSAYQGALAAENALLGAGRRIDLTGLPRVIFTAPQVAAAGLTEAQAVAAGYEVKTSLLPLDAVPRAIVNRETHGLVKLMADVATDRLLGASVLAEGAGDVIQAAVLAIRFGITTAELAGTFHPYLTMAEGLKLAAQTFTRDVHRLSCCAA